MGNFLKISYWFNVNAGELESKMEKGLLAFLGILLISAIFTAVIKKNKQNTLAYKVYNSLQLFFVGNLIIGAFLYFFTYEGIYFLSARFWFLLWGASMITWLGAIRKTIKKIPDIKENIKKQEAYNKYIP